MTPSHGHRLEKKQQVFKRRTSKSKNAMCERKGESKSEEDEEFVSQASSLASDGATTKSSNNSGIVETRCNKNDGESDSCSTLSSIPLKELRQRMRINDDRKKKHSKDSRKHPISSVSSSEKPKSLAASDRSSTTKANSNGMSGISSGTPASQRLQQNLLREESTNDEDGDNDEEEEPACCLCHSGLDCSDRALFFPKDRKKELEDEDGEYYFGMEDPYLPESLYDANNALVYCDTCNRLFHQKCHFVPIFVLPRGDWSCLICSFQREQQKQQKEQKSKARKHKQISNDGGVSQSEADESRQRFLFADIKICETIYPNPSGSTEGANKNKSNKEKDLLKTMPPNEEQLRVQQHFEVAASTLKAQVWQKHLKQLQTFCRSQAGNIRMAAAAWKTLTSTKRNRAHFTKRGISGQNKNQTHSQELAQTLVRWTMAKWKIRTALQNLESIRTGNSGALSLLSAPEKLIAWAREHPIHTDHVFPLGIEMFVKYRRLEPRTRELKTFDPMQRLQAHESKSLAATNETNRKAGAESQIPGEVTIQSPSSNVSRREIQKFSGSKFELRTKKEVGAECCETCSPLQKEIESDATQNGQKQIHNSGDDTDDDSGITLDDLQCCVCRVGDATDENDLILCDGQGCCRAFHMKCVHPVVKPEDIENEEEDWFCPLCSAISNLMADIQLASMDEDWEHRRQESSNEETSSLRSWAHADDVFPHSEWEYKTAMKLKAGKQNEDTMRLLHLYLGDNDGNEAEYQMPVGSDSEDENDYSLFDEASFEERRRKECRKDPENGENSNGDSDTIDKGIGSSSSVSTRSSQATLVDMSSVELEIGAAELAALSDGEESERESNSDTISSSSTLSNDRDDCSSEKSHRRSRRLQKRLAAALSRSEKSSLPDVGANFDERNIIQGKRRRKAVDYRKLNDVLFGDLSNKERQQLDDKDDYQMRNKG